MVAGDDLIEGIKVKLDGKYLGLFPKTNIFIIPKGKILAELPQELKRIKNIAFDKKYFGAIAVKIEERRNSALFARRKIAPTPTRAVLFLKKRLTFPARFF